MANERRELAAILDSLEPAQWDAPTLCAGWRVREVAAHMPMGFRYSLQYFVSRLWEAGASLMTGVRPRRQAPRLPMSGIFVESTPTRLAYVSDRSVADQ
ncbi:maleylpyruvate isomerase N-terminal domain-containing protein [Nonomuraea jabiensis]|uniref:maleylpyruvate isomerase N-terminal domain-containing protein n=1 Tax=Nonomuraea jabiensis TaxID=882448 RepID=UPI0034481F08